MATESLANAARVLSAARAYKTAVRKERIAQRTGSTDDQNRATDARRLAATRLLYLVATGEKSLKDYRKGMGYEE